MIRLPPSSTRTDTRSPSTTLFRSLVDGGVACSDRAPEIVRAVAEVQSSLAGSLGPVAVPERGDDGPVVAGEGLEGVVGHTFSEKLRSRAEERSEEHTSELQSLMRISYAVFCLKNKNTRIQSI